MSGFNAPTLGTGAFSFGSPATTITAPTLNFGTNTTSLAAPATATLPTFGAAAAQTAPTFGVPAAAAPTFGVPTASAAPAFGATATAPTFGATATAPTFGGTATVPAFGAAATVPTFGTTSAAPSFGATAAVPAFGATSAASTFPTFGASTAAPAFGNTNFGVPATTAAPAFGLSTSTAPAFGTATTTPSLFGVNTQGSTLFGANTAAAVPAFGVATSTAPTLGVSSFSFGKPTVTTSTGLNFGTPSTVLSAPQATPFVGLGGVDLSATQTKAGDAQQDIKAKETQVPDEITKTLEQLKNHIKTQKTLSSEIGRASSTKLSSVSSEIAGVEFVLRELSNYVDTNYQQIKSLRRETTKAIQAVEMSQRTQDTPSGLQYENTAPFLFFQNLVAKFEKDLINFRQQIVVTEQHMSSLTNPQSVAPEDLKRGFKHINESFISLAGRLHEVHQRVESLKEQYLNLRKYRLRDTRNIFAELDNPVLKVDSAYLSFGPTPFSTMGAITNFGKLCSSSNTAVSGNITGSSAK